MLIFYSNRLEGLAKTRKNKTDLVEMRKNQRKLASLISIITIVIFLVGNSNFIIYKYSLAQTANNVNFVRDNIFGGQISVDLPQGWGMSDNKDGSVTICNATITCKTASERVVIFPASSQSAEPSVSNTIQAEQPTTVQISGQQYVQQIVHIPFAGNLYTAFFYYLPEVEQVFQPIMERISTSISNPVTATNNPAINSLAIQTEQQANWARHCAAMAAINSGDVSPPGEFEVQNPCGFMQNLH